MSSIAEKADAFRALHNTPPGEPPVALLARAGIGSDGSTVLDFDKLRTGDATHIAEVQALLGGTGQIGSLKTIPEGQVITLDANSQAAVFGTFTVYGTLRIYGEMRFGPWPF